ncbi:hypothetical protein [Arcobacter vandammei]|uniref:hypothetical protein n=1 Tax=Arcobacter vandammei TaxID=2782243 RepID=UPI0018DF8017|nr:hypothetical protein [Arcobacter vandammei]
MNKFIKSIFCELSYFIIFSFLIFVFLLITNETKFLPLGITIFMFYLPYFLYQLITIIFFNSRYKCDNFINKIKLSLINRYKLIDTGKDESFPFYINKFDVLFSNAIFISLLVSSFILFFIIDEITINFILSFIFCFFILMYIFFHINRKIPELVITDKYIFFYKERQKVYWEDIADIYFTFSRYGRYTFNIKIRDIKKYDNEVFPYAFWSNDYLSYMVVNIGVNHKKLEEIFAKKIANNEINVVYSLKNL